MILEGKDTKDRGVEDGILKARLLSKESGRYQGKGTTCLISVAW